MISPLKFQKFIKEITNCRIGMLFALKVLSKNCIFVAKENTFKATEK